MSKDIESEERETIKGAYQYGYSHGRETVPKKIYPEAENPLDYYLQEFEDSALWNDIQQKLRKRAGYETVKEDYPYAYPPSGKEEYLYMDLERNFWNGILDGLEDNARFENLET